MKPIETTPVDRENLPPEISVDELEFGHVYLLEGRRYIASMNYVGKHRTLDPVTLDPVMFYFFDGPRANVHVALRARPGGGLQDHAGVHIKLRRYEGEDA